MMALGPRLCSRAGRARSPGERPGSLVAGSYLQGRRDGSKAGICLRHEWRPMASVRSMHGARMPGLVFIYRACPTQVQEWIDNTEHM